MKTRCSPIESFAACGVFVDSSVAPRPVQRRWPWALLLACAFGRTHLATVEAHAAEPGRLDDRVQGWRSDTDFLLDAIKREHYVFRGKPLPVACQRIADELKSSVGTMSDERAAAELLRLMATLGDGHCYIAPSDASRAKMPFKQLPLRLYRFSDGLFVIDADVRHEHWIGRQITRLGPVSTEDALRRVVDYVPSDNPHTGKVFGPIFCGYRGVLEALGLRAGADDIAIEFIGANKEPAEERVSFVAQRKLSQAERKLVPSRLAAAPPPPLYLRHAKDVSWIESIPEQDAIYVQLNQVWDAPQESLADLSERLDGLLRRKRPQLLVVDLRHNNGGDASLLDPLMVTFESFERRDPAAKLVVLIGPHTFSAAQILISQLDSDTNAVFAGEPSGSKPNFVGEDNVVELPWSHLGASISNRYHESIPGDTRMWIEPALKLELSSQDYFANRDPVLDAVWARWGRRDRR